MQDCYPAQADPGYTTNGYASLKAALKNWEKRRGLTEPTWRNNGGLFKASKPVARDEVAWNRAPREPKPKMSLEERRQKRRDYMRGKRGAETPEAKAARLVIRRAKYLESQGGVRKKSEKLTPEGRIQAAKEAQLRYRERQKLGLVAPRPAQPKRILTEDQKRKKAAKQRELYYATRSNITGASTAKPVA